MKTGLLFGSFNPVHHGHLIVAEYFVQSGLCDDVWLVVSPRNPFKTTLELADATHRLAMARLAIGDDPRLAVSDLEFGLSVPSYTVDSLKEFRKIYPEREFVLILGEDILPSFHKWKQYQEILNKHEVLVFPRISESPIPSEYYEKKQMTRVPAPLIGISSTYIRNLIHAGKEVRHLAPLPVLDYIMNHNLYK